MAGGSWLCCVAHSGGAAVVASSTWQAGTCKGRGLRVCRLCRSSVAATSACKIGKESADLLQIACSTLTCSCRVGAVYHESGASSPVAVHSNSLQGSNPVQSSAQIQRRAQAPSLSQGTADLRGAAAAAVARRVRAAAPQTVSARCQSCLRCHSRPHHHPRRSLSCLCPSALSSVWLTVRRHL